MVSDKMIHKAFRIKLYASIKQNPLLLIWIFLFRFSLFTKLYFGFKLIEDILFLL